MSDHFPCFIPLGFPRTHIKGKHIYTTDTSPTALNKFKEEIKNANLSAHMQPDLNTDPNINYDKIDTALMTAKRLHLPLKRVKFNKTKHKKSPWITRGIIKSLISRDKLYRSLKQCPLGSHDYNALNINLRTFNRILKRNIYLVKQDYYNNVFNQYKYYIKKTWGTIKDILNKNKNNNVSPDSLEIDGVLTQDNKKLPDHFNTYFANKMVINFQSKYQKTINLMQYIQIFLTVHLNHTLNFH